MTLGKKQTIAAGKGELDVELSAPADVAATGTPTQFTIVGSGDGSGDAAGEHVASTLAPLRQDVPANDVRAAGTGRADRALRPCSEGDAEVAAVQFPLPFVT